MLKVAADREVGVLGATSFVGVCLLKLLARDSFKITAFSRKLYDESFYGEYWEQLPLSLLNGSDRNNIIPMWICVAPIWFLPEYFPLLEKKGVRRIVVLSSTSIFTKDNSSDLGEQTITRRLANAENAVQVWAAEKGVEWVVLRPTLIYGKGQDKNISEIIRFVRRFGFFPLLGKAEGLRQPVHCEDVAQLCVSALKTFHISNKAYNISGGETMTYRAMVERIFISLDMPSRFLLVPLSLFKLALSCLRLLPKYKHWSSAMAERMNRDLVFDHEDAVRDFGYKPRPFKLLKDDLLIK